MSEQSWNTPNMWKTFDKGLNTFILQLEAMIVSIKEYTKEVA